MTFLYSRESTKAFARGYRVGQTRRELIKSTSHPAAIAGTAARLPTGRHAADALVSPLYPTSSSHTAELNANERARLAILLAAKDGADDEYVYSCARTRCTIAIEITSAPSIETQPDRNVRVTHDQARAS
jgi:hypothetical protein